MLLCMLFALLLTFVILLHRNFSHFVMYYYYVLTTLGYQPWWKKYITTMQLAQFVCMNAQAIYIIASGCPFPRNITVMYLAYILSLFFLFLNFFFKTYGGEGKKQSTKSKSKLA